ncbi:hypothetical protein HDU85_003926 [Gaertneriomyces sp. JEL0708]|nr:hypothetical protein HDU85_003926 [Gaertneriomyces sp. JEL0708]
MSAYIDAFSGLAKAIMTNGPRRALRQVLTINQPRVGKFVGEDSFGNQYFENRNDIVLRDRWVEYKKWNYDATQVPPEWHQWLTHITDDIPNAQTLPRPFFSPEKPLENVSGSAAAYKPYSTTVPKYSAWKPEVRERQG